MPITNTTRIIDLPTKSSLGSGDYFAVDNENGDTSKILATSVSGSSTAGLVAKEYSNAQTYDKGDYCIHVENNVPGLYRANQDIPTAETWTAAHWDPTDAGSELTTANADIEALNQSLTETEITLTATTSSAGVIATDLDYNLKIKHIYADDGSRKYYCLTRPSGQLKLVVVVLTEATTTLSLVTNTNVTLHIFKADA